eukprot:3381780-Pyramimonas_sp.AAC.1
MQMQAGARESAEVVAMCQTPAVVESIFGFAVELGSTCTTASRWNRCPHHHVPRRHDSVSVAILAQGSILFPGD